MESQLNVLTLQLVIGLELVSSNPYQPISKHLTPSYRTRHSVSPHQQQHSRPYSVRPHHQQHSRPYRGATGYSHGRPASHKLSPVLRMSYAGGYGPANLARNKNRHLKKVSFYQNSVKKNIVKSNAFHRQPTTTRKGFENFVTLKTSDPFASNKYEVTTKPFRDVQPSGDKDFPLAIDDEEEGHLGVRPLPVTGEEDDDESEEEHVDDSKVYVDSYGRVQGRGEASAPGSSVSSEDSGGEEHGAGEQARWRGYRTHDSYGYGVVHPPPQDYKQPEGRVRMQVFRGPTRTHGHKKYTPWGYFVIQPSEGNSPYHQPPSNQQHLED